METHPLVQQPFMVDARLPFSAGSPKGTYAVQIETVIVRCYRRPFRQTSVCCSVVYKGTLKPSTMQIRASRSWCNGHFARPRQLFHSQWFPFIAADFHAFQTKSSASMLQRPGYQDSVRKKRPRS